MKKTGWHRQSDTLVEACKAKLASDTLRFIRALKRDENKRFLERETKRLKDMDEEEGI